MNVWFGFIGHGTGHDASLRDLVDAAFVSALWPARKLKIEFRLCKQTDIRWNSIVLTSTVTLRFSHSKRDGRVLLQKKTKWQNENTRANSNKLY